MTAIRKTRWKITFSPPFFFKFLRLRDRTDRRNIKKYVILIANHPDPANIGGCASCSDGISTKLRFGTDWIVIYQMNEPVIRFVGFYKEKAG